MQSVAKSLNSLSLEDRKEVVVFYHPDTQLHQSSKKHPEQPARVQAILNLIKKHPQLTVKDMSQKDSLPQKQEVQALANQLQSTRYVQFIQEMWDSDSKRTEMYINMDTYYSKYTYQSALAAAKTAIAATDYVLKHKQARVYAVIRPPGHHSGWKPQPHGFSFLNNIAIAAHKTIQSKSAKRVAIVDWDVHHGEGTQNLFYNRSDILYISLHRFDKGKFFPHIPQSGSQFIGEGKGKGFNINICWNLPEKPQGSARERDETVGNEEYVYAFKTIMLVLKQFDPDLILISCGFDSAQGDQFGGLQLTSTGYSFMLNQLLSMKTPLAVVLQGGYNLQVLEWGSETVIKCLSGQGQVQELAINKQCNKIGLQGVQNCLKNIKPFWKSLQ